MGRARGAAAILLLVFFVRGQISAGCRCGDGALDIVLVIDATGSMHLAIGTVKGQMAKIVDILAGRFETLRVGVVAYRTAEGPEFVVKSLPLTDDVEKVKAFLADLRASGGGEEAVYEGLREAVNMHFAADARKIAILVGDEPPARGTEERMRLLAAEAKTMGIMVHSITMSETAWRYYEFNDPEGFQKLRESGVTEAEMSRTFVIPAFREVSDVTGGSAVPGVSARDIVKWLLALSSGDSSLSSAADEVLAMETAVSGELRAGYPLLMVRIRCDGSSYSPRDLHRLLAHLEEYLPVPRFSILDGVSILDERAAAAPILYLCGHGAVTLSRDEEERLKKYVESGGRLWADACCGDAAFKESFCRLVERLFAGAVLARLPSGHQVFSAAVPIREVRYTERHRVARYVNGEPEAYGWEVSGSLAVLLTPHSWGAGWGSYPFGRPCLMHDDDALALTLNLLVYWMEGN